MMIYPPPFLILSLLIPHSRLSVVLSLNMQIAVHCVALTMGDGHIMLGLRDGKVIILTVANAIV